MQLLLTIGTIAGIAACIAGGIALWAALHDRIKKGEPEGSPFLLICCVVSEAR
jgi:hypothetical protein